ncbi:MAG TPA: ABC transporter permease, partial [Dehalococcoidia bacterium]|nr:ABC transporter permease [Dehalococcoidia bacterium]
GLLRWHATQTLVETVLGFALAVATAAVFATILEFSRLARAALLPVLIASQTVPIVALAPLLVLWFGYGALPKILVVALVCFFPMVIALVHGFAETEPDLVRLYRSFGASRLQIFRLVQVPTSLPVFFAGMRIAVTYSVIGAVFGEYVGAVRGLGIFLQTAKNSYRTDLVFSMIAVTAALSLLLYGAVLLLERLTIPWANSAPGAPTAPQAAPRE